MTENLGLIISSSDIFHNEIDRDLKNSNCHLPELDVFGLHWNYESCLQQLLHSNYKFYFSNLPHLTAYLDTLNATQFSSYFEAALNAVRLDANNQGNKVETADIKSMNSLLHFVENLYAAHDANSNWLISEAELRQAYPKFEKISTTFAYRNSSAAIKDFKSWQGDVAGYACFSEQDLIRESFIFLIYNGRAPKTADFNSFPCFHKIPKPLMNFYGEVDRIKMINSLGSMKSVLGL